MAAKDNNIIVVKGVSFKVDPDLFENDYELVELLNDIDEKPYKFPNYIKLLTGDKYETVKDALRDDNGKITLTAMRDFADEFAQKVGDLKN